MWRGPESGLPQGPRWLSAGLSKHIGILHLVSISTTITAVDMSFCTSLRNFIQNGPPSAEKNDIMSIFKMADHRHLGF